MKLCALFGARCSSHLTMRSFSLIEPMVVANYGAPPRSSGSIASRAPAALTEARFKLRGSPIRQIPSAPAAGVAAAVLILTLARCFLPQEHEESRLLQAEM